MKNQIGLRLRVLRDGDQFAWDHQRKIVEVKFLKKEVT